MVPAATPSEHLWHQGELRTLAALLLEAAHSAAASPLGGPADGWNLARNAVANAPDVLNGLERTGDVVAVLDALVEHALSAGVAARSPRPSPWRAPDLRGDDPGPPLAPPGAPAQGPSPEGCARWIERVATACRRVDPHGLDIVRMRVEGRDDREIARDLELGLRLVGRVRLELFAALRRTP